MINRFMKGDNKNPSYYYITQTWLDGLKLTINQFQREAEKGFGWLYYSYLDADIDIGKLNAKYLDLRSSSNRFKLFYDSVFSKAAQFSDKELADAMGLDLSKTSDQETLTQIRGVIPSGEVTGAARGEAIIQLVGNMRNVVNHIKEEHGEEFAKRFMAQFYSPWHSDFLGKNKRKVTNTYDDFFTALEVLASGTVLRNVLAKELQVLEVLQKLPAIEFGLNKDQKKTYPAYEVAAKFSSLGIDAKYQIAELFRKEYGENWEKRMDVSKDWGRFAVVVEYAGKLPAPFAPYLLSEIGDQLMKYHPYNIDVMLQLITSASNVFYRINDFEGITTYYAALPHKMDKIFIDIFDIKEATKRGAKTAQPFGAAPIYGEGELEGLGRLMMDSMPKDIRVIPPSDATGDYAYMYSPSVGVIIRIPRQVYNSFSTVDLYGTAKSVTPDVLKSPAGSPSILGIPKQWFEQGLVDVFVSRPTPQMYPFFSINKLHMLLPDQLPRVGEFTSFMANYNMVYNSTSTVSEKEATHPEFETGQQIPVAVRETAGASAQTHVFSGIASGGGKELTSDVTVSKAKSEPTVMTITPKDTEKRLESVTTTEEGDVVKIEGVPEKTLEIAKEEETIDYSGKLTLRNIPGVIENNSLLVGHGTIQGNQDRLEQLQIFLNEIAPEGNDTVLYFDRTYRENKDEEKVPYYRVYSFKRFRGGHITEIDYTDLSKEEAEATYGRLFDKEDRITRRVHKGYARAKAVGGGFELELEGAFLMVETKPKEGEEEPEVTDKEFQGVGGAAQIGRFGAFTLYEHTRGKHLAIGAGDFDKLEKNFTVGRFFWSKEEDKMETDFWLYRSDKLEVKAFLAQKEWESFAGAGLFHYVSTGFRMGGALLGKSSAIGTEGEFAGEDLYGGHFYLTDPNYANALVLSALYQKSGGRADFLAGAAGEAVLGALNLRVGTRFDIRDVKGDPDYEGKNFAQVVYTPEGDTVVQSLVANGVYVDIEDKKAGVIGGGGDFYVDATRESTLGGELYYLPKSGGAGEVRYRSPTFDAVVGGSLKSDIAPYSLWTGARVKWRGGETYGVFTYTQEDTQKEAEEESKLKGDTKRTYQGAFGVSFSLVPDLSALDQYATVWTLTAGMPFLVQELGDNSAWQIDPQLALTVSGDKHQGAVIFRLQHWESDLIDEGREDIRTTAYVTGTYSTTAIPWWDTTALSFTFFTNLQRNLTRQESSTTEFEGLGTGFQFTIRADGF
ncbi:hypothetical protein HYT84_03790 [Candidatus Micrarchaeota archaeon]|nr:hypothetical protein [Candidatus Micrarchaeota archaeon]